MRPGLLFGVPAFLFYGPDKRLNRTSPLVCELEKSKESPLKTFKCSAFQGRNEEGEAWVVSPVQSTGKKRERRPILLTIIPQSRRVQNRVRPNLVRPNVHHSQVSAVLLKSHFSYQNNSFLRKVARGKTSVAICFHPCFNTIFVDFISWF